MESDNPLSSPNRNPLKCPPGALNQLSPERMNQQRIPQSPSLHSYLIENDRPRSRESMTSEVQCKVAFLNSLSTQSSPTRAPRAEKIPALIPAASLAGSHGNTWQNNGNNNNINGNTNSAFQRAVMGYEEAQASLATLSAELERCKEELGARKKRERMIAQRVETLLEELQADKDKRARDQESYAKEVKRCRKETYRAELALVESREELKELRSELKKSHAETQHEKIEKEKSRQEAFERAYALAGVLEEMEQVKDRLKATEKERDTAIEEARSTLAEKAALESAQSHELNTAANQQQEARSSKWLGDYEGRCTTNLSAVSESSTAHYPLPSFYPLYPSFDSIKFRLDIYEKQMEEEEITPEEEILFLKQELKCAKRQHKEAEDLIHFMHMQCQFKACPCRIAESDSERFVHDHVYDAELRQQRISKKRKISAEGFNLQQAQREPAQRAPPDELLREETPRPMKKATSAGDIIALPPDPTPEELSGALEEPAYVQQALELPLPEPQPMELDSVSTTPEATAQLEEITQVLVEPGTASKPFSFSTSTTSHAATRSAAPPLRHTESASACLEQDLFDLSPPKQAQPRRPSTAMGILTVDSPIRLIPDSPRSYKTTCDEYARSTTPTFDRHQMFTESTTTTKIALKDSSPRSSLHRRAQSRPNIRSHSPLVSSMASNNHQSAMNRGSAKETSASPAASTVFPVTPLDRHARSMHNMKQHAQTQERRAPQTIAASTTTTRVPLRGFADADDVFSPLRDGNGHAHTEVIRTTTVATDSTALHSFQHHSRPGALDHNTRDSKSDPNSASILGNVPGTPISREAALAQIRARRDRARSVNLKRSTGSLAGGQGSGAVKSPTKPRVVNGVTGAGGIFAQDRDGARREISQASAPGRFAC
ncbi:uncharacterized protein A1O9_03710 [Exophiala aquamarina CBS 119918]|uniref:Uncharacterized protein n=1 Tax=Exophiala aquamarina CBS 119918 TaxID=1182545 RepID=A0A072PGJ9_9EURO|nr:uncharacterized protein A1O9_03710 [Exophiala aquamarina CBS 119918]KEF58867.1 hypothetical protein A1O9_03710 [Exophiala aquamarina CBS 119918]